MELLYRQMTRRMMYSSLASGWAAWVEMWSAKLSAMRALSFAGARFRRPELASAFTLWADVWAARKHRKQVSSLEMANRSVEAQLRHAHFENGQIEMRRVAQEDELLALRTRLQKLTAESDEKDATVSGAVAVGKERDNLRSRLKAAEEAAAAALAARDEAQADSIVQRTANKELVERLLGEQRKQFDEEMASLKETLRGRTSEWAQAAERRHDVESEVSGLRAEVERLKEEVITAGKKRSPNGGKGSPRSTSTGSPTGRPPPVKTSPTEGRKSKGPLGGMDLDEGPNAKPIAQQLADALRARASKVLDLFRSWDENGDGEGKWHARFQPAPHQSCITAHRSLITLSLAHVNLSHPTSGTSPLEPPLDPPS